MNSNNYLRDLYLDQIDEFKKLVHLIIDLNKNNDHHCLLSALKKIELNFNYIKRFDDYEFILKETNLFKILNDLLIKNNDKQILNQLIIILFEYNLEFQFKSTKDNKLDNQLFMEHTIIKNLIDLFKKQNINDHEFEIERSLILIKSSLNYSIDNNLLTAIDYKFLFNDLLLKLKELNLFKIQSQKILNNLLNILAILLKIKDNDNFINSIDFNELIEYTKVNIDYINCSNLEKLLSCLNFFITNFSECYDLFLNQYDGLKFLEKIKLDKIVIKLKSFIDSNECIENEFQEPEIDNSSINKINKKNEKSNKIKVQKQSLIQFIDLDSKTMGNRYETALSFDEMNLKKELLKGIYDYGLKIPTDIQQTAILPSIKGYNVIMEAATGTGKKTAAIISMLQQIDYELDECQAIILTSSQESANQISELILTFGKYSKINCYSCISRKSISNDIDQLKMGKQVVLGLPSRILELVNNGVLKTNKIKLIILDKANIILSNDLKGRIYGFFSRLDRKELQIIQLSDIIDSVDVLEFATKFMIDPIRILIGNEFLLKNSKQFYINIEEEELKFKILYDILISTSEQIIIYCNSTQMVNSLVWKMREFFVKISYLHSQMMKKEIDEMINEFKTGSSPILISDNQSLGKIDNQNVLFIINYELPKKEHYIYRATYGNRFNSNCKTINFVKNNDQEKLNSIEQFYNTRMIKIDKNDHIYNYI